MKRILQITALSFLFLTLTTPEPASGQNTQQDRFGKLAESLFKRFDRDNDGKLDQTEANRLPMGLTWEQTDKDSNQSIDLEELKAAFEEMSSNRAGRGGRGGFGGSGGFGGTGGMRTPPRGGRSNPSGNDGRPGSEQQDDVLDVGEKIETTKLDIGFSIGKLIVDRDVQRAVAVGSSSGGRNNFPNSGGYDELAVIDLANKKVLVRKKMPSGILRVHVDDKYVYIVPQSGSLIYRYDRDTMENSKRMFTKSPVTRFASPFQGVIHLYSSSSNHFDALDREKMELVNSPNQRNNNRFHESPSMGHQTEHSNGMRRGRIRYAGGIYDENSGELVALVQAPNFYNLARGSGNAMTIHAHMHGRTNTLLPTRFGRYTSGNQLFSSTQQMVANYDASGRFGGNTLLISRDQPALYRLRRTNVRSHRDPVRLYFEVHRLTDNEVVGSWLVNGAVQNPQQLFELEDGFVIRDQTTLHFMSMPEFDTSKLEMPLHFDIQPLKPWSPDQIQTVNLKTLGGKNESQFQLRTEYPGLELNSKTGELKVDLPVICKSLTKMDYPTAQQLQQYLSTYSPDTAKRHRVEIRDDHVPFYIPITAVVSDSEGAMDQMQIYPIISVPLDELKKTTNDLINKYRAEQRRSQEAARRAAEMRRAEAMKDERKGDLPSNPGDLQRINELENRVRRLEAALDSILLKLEKLTGDQ